MNTNWTGFRPLNVMRVLNISGATIGQGAPLAITGYAWIMDSSLSPRVLPDGSTQTGTRLQIPTVDDIRSHDPVLEDMVYVGIARENIPTATVMDPTLIGGVVGIYEQDGIGDCVLDGVCYVDVDVPNLGTNELAIDIGDPLFFDLALAPTMVTSFTNLQVGTEDPRQLGIALGALGTDGGGAASGLILAFIDQFPRQTGESRQL